MTRKISQIVTSLPFHLTNRKIEKVAPRILTSPRLTRYAPAQTPLIISRQGACSNRPVNSLPRTPPLPRHWAMLSHTMDRSHNSRLLTFLNCFTVELKLQLAHLCSWWHTIHDSATQKRHDSLTQSVMGNDLIHCVYVRWNIDCWCCCCLIARSARPRAERYGRESVRTWYLVNHVSPQLCSQIVIIYRTQPQNGSTNARVTDSTNLNSTD